jgi:uncharacterized protein YcbK (DUF882 family)
MKLTDHFQLSEFKCKNGVEVPQALIPRTQALAEALEIVRAEATIQFGQVLDDETHELRDRRLHVISGYRDPAYNKGCGGAPRSRHMKGDAADVTIDGMTPDQVADMINALIRAKKIPQGGLGRYVGWVHYDLRGTVARWDHRTSGKRG